MWKHVTYNQAVSTAQGIAKSECDLVLRQLERDISMARATPSMEIGAGSLNMTITQKDDAGGYTELPVSYSWNGTTLRRDADTSRVLTKYLAQENGLNIRKESTASGVVYIEIMTEVPVQGENNLFKSHRQDFMATIREEAAGMGTDKRWQRSSDVKKNF